MPMANAGTIYSVARNAKEVFERNIDTLVAGFLIRHPDVLPGEIELVMRHGEDRALHIQIERKDGIRFPEELQDTSEQLTTDPEFNRGVIHGWNSALKAFHDINPPFTGTESRAEPQGFGDVVDAEVLSETNVVVVS